MIHSVPSFQTSFHVVVVSTLFELCFKHVEKISNHVLLKVDG